LPRDGAGHGAGFAAGGALDALAPGPGLAGFTDDAHARLAGLDDDALIGVLRGWRRLAAWAQARELATITELARRRPAGGAPPAPPGQLPARMSEFIADEIAVALTLTGHAAGTQLKPALDLAPGRRSRLHWKPGGSTCAARCSSSAWCARCRLGTPTRWKRRFCPGPGI
jgi:hypothetical protein